MGWGVGWLGPAQAAQCKKVHRFISRAPNGTPASKRSLGVRVRARIKVRDRIGFGEGFRIGIGLRLRIGSQTGKRNIKIGAAVQPEALGGVHRTDVACVGVFVVHHARGCLSFQQGRHSSRVGARSSMHQRRHGLRGKSSVRARGSDKSWGQVRCVKARSQVRLFEADDGPASIHPSIHASIHPSVEADDGPGVVTLGMRALFPRATKPSGGTPAPNRLWRTATGPDRAAYERALGPRSCTSEEASAVPSSSCNTGCGTKISLSRPIQSRKTASQPSQDWGFDWDQGWGHNRVCACGRDLHGGIGTDLHGARLENGVRLRALSGRARSK